MKKFDELPVGSRVVIKVNPKIEADLYGIASPYSFERVYGVLFGFVIKKTVTQKNDCNVYTLTIHLHNKGKNELVNDCTFSKKGLFEERVIELESFDGTFKDIVNDEESLIRTMKRYFKSLKLNKQFENDVDEKIIKLNKLKLK